MQRATTLLLVLATVGCGTHPAMPKTTSPSPQSSTQVPPSDAAPDSNDTPMPPAQNEGPSNVPPTSPQDSGDRPPADRVVSRP